MRRAAAVAAAVALALAGAAVALVDRGGEGPSAPGVAHADQPGRGTATVQSRANDLSETLDRSVCRRRDLGQWDREKAPRDFAPRCIHPAHSATP